MRGFLFSLLALCFWSTQAQNIDTIASKVNFEVENLGFNTVEGSFSSIKGWAYLNPDAKHKSLLKVCLDAASIETGIGMRDKKLKTEDFFDVSQYPEICFTGTNFRYLGDNIWEVSGNLKIKDQVKKITVRVVQQNGALTCVFTVNRFDFNIGEDYSEFSIGAEVKVTVQIAHR